MSLITNHTLAQTEFVLPTTSRKQVQLHNVLHVINGEHFSGAERVQQHLGRRLPENGFRALFACVKPGKFPGVCGLQSDTVFSTPMRGRFDFRVLGTLRQLVKEQSVQLLHAHTPRTAMLCSVLSRMTKLPWVYHVHSPTSRDSTRGFVNRINSMIEGYSIRNCDCLITVSQSLASEMQRLGVNPSKLVTVANGVPEVEPIEAKQRLSESQWRLGMVALMRPRKGVEVAVQAIAKLRDFGCPVTLELIGGFETPEYEAQIHELINKLNVAEQILLTGFVTDVPAAIRKLDALVLPSLFGEGMPMVVLEALAAAVPVVATRVEGTPEVVRDGIEGALAEPQNVTSLVERIAWLCDDRSRWVKLSQQALERHRNHFSDARMAAGVAQAYRLLLP